ncbi:MAG: AI-2E family transporter [Chthonomonas sp.]|nr:AI-2E family transporter [Chthonomonas sp.]
MNELDRQYKKFGFWALIAVVLLLVAMVLAPFAQALMWSVVLSVLSYPLYKRFCSRFNEVVSSLLTILSTVFLVAIPLGLVGLLVFLQFRGVADDFEKHATNPAVTTTKTKETPITRLAQQIDTAIQPTLKQFDIDFKVDEYVRENGQEIARTVTGPVTKGATAFAVSAVMMVVSFLTMFFMLKDGHKLLKPAIELIPLPEAWTRKILSRVQQTIKAVFIGVVLVALIQGAAAGIGYAISGVEGWLVWAFATFVLCVIPLLGAPIVYVPFGLILLMQGKIWQGVFLLVWGFVVISNIDNFLRPKYIGEAVGLHYIAIFFSLLGGILAFGPVGLIAGPALLTIFLELIAFAREERAKSLESNAENPSGAAEVAP